MTASPTEERQSGDKDTTKKTARVAGVLYLLVGGTGFFSLIYVSRTLIVPGNAAATADNILASESLFRIGMAAELISATALLLLSLTLYRLFQGVDKAYASVMVIFVAVSVPISFLNVANEITALNLLTGANFLSVFDRSQMDAMAMVFLGLHRSGIVVVNIFWGLWLFPFGALVRKSGFLPGILGVLLIIACFAYLANSAIVLLLPLYNSIVSPVLVVPEGLGEGSMIAWLLIKGAKDRPLAVQPSDPGLGLV